MPAIASREPTTTMAELHLNVDGIDRQALVFVPGPSATGQSSPSSSSSIARRDIDKGRIGYGKSTSFGRMRSSSAPRACRRQHQIGGSLRS
jgi:hypothetical protein